MLNFVHYPLLWGMALLALPLLIHLINMFRHRRVRWAAMEFLLVSQRKNRTWILLRQLLLLLMRMAAVALVVLVVAQPLLPTALGNFLGGSRTHHIVLLDDSYSMSDRWADTSAWDEARTVVREIAAQAGQQVEPQSFTLLRFSRVGRGQRGTEPDLLEESVDSDFSAALDGMLGGMEPSQSAAGPAAALDAVGQLLDQSSRERRIVYLVSDLRARPWADPADLREKLLEMDRQGAELFLVHCVDAARPNLALSRLAPAEGTRAAGVRMAVDVTVHNHGTAPARNVTVLLEEDSRARPAVTIAEIPPRQAVTERFAASFPTAGEHTIAARLEEDAVAADNRRFAVTSIPATNPVLLVDGDPDALDARFLNLALAPRGPVTTGVQPQIETPRYLSARPLDAFRAVYLLNVERLDEAALQALERYVSNGGGLGVFLGERTSGRFVNDDLYREGKGLFPLPLGSPTELIVDRLQKAPDIDPGDHPVFRILSGQRNPFREAVVVSRYFPPRREWSLDPKSGVRVIAKLRNGDPLAVEKTLGDGRVVAFLTTAAPVWNNWARDPSFLVAVQELQSYLGGRSLADVDYPVGKPLELAVDPTEYQAKIRFTLPESAAAPPAAVDAAPGPDGQLAASFLDTDVAGVYQARLTRSDSTPEVRRYAYNVDPGEGDLDTVTGEQLADGLKGVNFRYVPAGRFASTDRQAGGVNLSQSLLLILVLVLLAEQVLAWITSYHPSRRGAPAVQGGAA